MDIDSDSPSEPTYRQPTTGIVPHLPLPRAKEPPPQLSSSIVLSNVVDRMANPKADLEKIPHRELVPPESLADADPSEAGADDVPMPEAEDPRALAKRFAQTEAMLQHERDNRVHAEQILETYIAGQGPVATPPHTSSVGSPRSPRDEPPDPLKVLNPLERIEIEHERFVQVHSNGISAAD